MCIDPVSFCTPKKYEKSDPKSLGRESPFIVVWLLVPECAASGNFCCYLQYFGHPDPKTKAINIFKIEPKLASCWFILGAEKCGKT